MWVKAFMTKIMVIRDVNENISKQTSSYLLVRAFMKDLRL